MDILFSFFGIGRKQRRRDVLINSEVAIENSRISLENTKAKHEKLTATLNGEEYWMLKCMRKVVKECVQEKVDVEK